MMLLCGWGAGYGGRCTDGICEIYGGKIKFVRFVRTVRFQSVIV